MIRDSFHMSGLVARRCSSERGSDVKERIKLSKFRWNKSSIVTFTPFLLKNQRAFYKHLSQPYVYRFHND